jgi:transaldolase
MPTPTGDQIAWALVEEISATRAKLLEHIFDGHRGSNGRLSIQTDPRLYRNPRALVDQAMHFSTLAPNMIVKIPVTTAGVKAMEEATVKGMNINATVCFSLSQSVAVAEAIERGLMTREKAGLDISTMGRSVRSWWAHSTIG